MKHGSLLIALCVLFSFSASAQSTTTIEKKTNRITITTKKTDESGKTITETYIAEGDEPAKILEGMAIQPDLIEKMNVETISDGEEGERLFLIRSAGDNVVLEGKINENVNESENGVNRQIEKIVIINEDGNTTKQVYKIKTPHEKWKGHAGVWVKDKENINCAALGVFVSHRGEENGGARILSLIENGGALAAGLKEGDVLRKIEEFDINDFPTLHLALSHFKPGDVVMVRYDREGKTQKSKIELKDWAQLPGHEWRSRSDCGEPEVIETEDNSIIDEPSGIRELQPLTLEEIRMFPNPTDGIVALSFRTQPGPLTISIADVNGKIVYQDHNENGAGSYSKEIDLKSIPSGHYVLTVTQGDKIYTDQISKQ